METSYNLPAGEPYCAPEMISIVEANISILRGLVNIHPWTSIINEVIKERLKQTKNLVKMISSQTDVCSNGRLSV